MKSVPEVLGCLDPGLREAGIAVFRRGVLSKACLVRNPERTIRGPRAWTAIATEAARRLEGLELDTLILEVPQVYAQGKWKGDPADLIELAGVDGAVAQALHPRAVYGYLPREWKGQTPKPIHNARVEATLTPAELAVMDACPASLRHNMLDAVGLGLFQLGRLAGPRSPSH